MGGHHGDDPNGHGQFARDDIGDETVVVVGHVQQLCAGDVGEIGTGKMTLCANAGGAVGEFAGMGFGVVHQLGQILGRERRVHGQHQGRSPQGTDGR